MPDSGLRGEAFCNKRVSREIENRRQREKTEIEFTGLQGPEVPKPKAPSMLRPLK